jgi:[ribosomal protein S18]-alanine N-acetyltransferase
LAADRYAGGSAPRHTDASGDEVGTGGIIRRCAGADEAALCARMMVSTDPWRTLGRTYDATFALLVDPWREVWVHEGAAGIDGCIVLVLQGAFVGYIQAIVVADHARGSGVGTALLASAEERIRRVSPAVFLTVSSFNPRARALYERLGFEVVGELRDFLVDGHSEIVMWKRSMSWATFTSMGEG